ncbi:MAG: GNAT family N-acetyltransferase, partial [Ignavibacteria bacterium]|nr:GNAT family N-acetyltransferase [Ignavibacteria bacterium]
MIFEETKDGFLLSTDKSKLDVDCIFDFLSNRSYWAKGVPRDRVARSIENSMCFGIYENNKQVGFARIITDMATIGYLGDVFIVEEYRGRGLSKWLMECILKHPELSGLRRWILLTKDAHSLYRKYGFKDIEEPETYMELRNPNVYKK